MGSVASIVRFNSEDDLFDKDFIRTINVPSDDDFETSKPFAIEHFLVFAQLYLFYVSMA